MSDVNYEEFGTAVPHQPSGAESERIMRALNSSVEDVEPVVAKDEDLTKMVPTQWTMAGPNAFVCVPNSVKTLPAGLYNVQPQRNGGVMFEKQQLQIDELMDFPDSKIDKILTDIDTFWAEGEKFYYHGFLHRRGYMFYGPQGSGKTCLVQQLVSNIIKANGIVFYCTKPLYLQLGLTVFRTVEPNRPVICIFEDIDAIIKENGDDVLLSLLDGENQVDRVLNIATTNYPELLDRRIVNRPRRFDRVIRIDWPGDGVRRLYFEKKLKIAGSELDQWVAATERLSFAACAELVISVKCLGKDFNDTVKILKEQNAARPKSSEYDADESKVGFGGFKNG